MKNFILPGAPRWGGVALLPHVLPAAERKLVELAEGAPVPQDGAGAT